MPQFCCGKSFKMKNLDKFLSYSVLLLLVFCSGNIMAQCNADAGPDMIRCIGSNIQLDGTNSTVPAGGITYEWSPVTGLSCTNCPSPICNVGTTTTYTLEITNGSGCTTTDQVTVTVAAPPTSSFTYNQPDQCANQPVPFTSTSSGTGLSYLWNFDNIPSGGNNSSVLSSPTHFFVSNGSGSITCDVELVVTDINGCQSSSTQTVTVDQTPGAALIDPLTSLKNCDGSNYNLTVFNNSVGASNSNYQIIWDDGTADYNAATFPGGGVNHLYTINDIFDALFIVTGNNGCIDTSFNTISNITNPAIGAANPGSTNGCGPLNLCFPLSNFVGNHNTTIYVVDYGDNSALDTLPHPPPATICHTYTETSCGLPGNSYTFSIKAINLCDSSEATISPIRVYTAPVADFEVAPNPGCAGSTITFINNSIAGSNSSCSASTVVNWDFGDGNTLTQFTIQNATNIYANPGTYPVTLSTQNGCGTTVKDTVVCIEAPPIPEFTITPDTACVPFISSITDLSDLSNTCDVTYNWQVLFTGSNCAPSAGTFNFVNGTSATDQEPDIEFVDPGQYTVRLTLTNACGSFTYDQFVLGKSIPQVTLNPVSAICAGQTVAPVANYVHCYDSIDIYAWTFPSGSPISSNQAVPGAITYPSAGNYNINIQVTNACGNANATTPIVVNGAPASLVPTVNTPLCEGQDANFDAPTVAGLTYVWTGVNGFSSGLEDPSILGVSIADSGWYYLSSLAGGCPGPLDSVLLDVVSAPVITVVPSNPIICENDTVGLTASGAATYTWTSSTGLNTTSGA